MVRMKSVCDSPASEVNTVIFCSSPATFAATKFTSSDQKQQSPHRVSCLPAIKGTISDMDIQKQQKQHLNESLVHHHQDEEKAQQCKSGSLLQLNGTKSITLSPRASHSGNSSTLSDSSSLTVSKFSQTQLSQKQQQQQQQSPSQYQAPCESSLHHGHRLHHHHHNHQEQQPLVNDTARYLRSPHCCSSSRYSSSFNSRPTVRHVNLPASTASPSTVDHHHDSYNNQHSYLVQHRKSHHHHSHRNSSGNNHKQSSGDCSCSKCMQAMKRKSQISSSHRRKSINRKFLSKLQSTQIWVDCPGSDVEVTNESKTPRHMKYNNDEQVISSDDKCTTTTTTQLHLTMMKEDPFANLIYNQLLNEQCAREKNFRIQEWLFQSSHCKEIWNSILNTSYSDYDDETRSKISATLLNSVNKLYNSQVNKCKINNCNQQCTREQQRRRSYHHHHHHHHHHHQQQQRSVSSSRKGRSRGESEQDVCDRATLHRVKSNKCQLTGATDESAYKSSHSRSRCVCDQCHCCDDKGSQETEKQGKQEAYTRTGMKEETEEEKVENENDLTALYSVSTKYKGKKSNEKCIKSFEKINGSTGNISNDTDKSQNISSDKCTNELKEEDTVVALPLEIKSTRMNDLFLCTNSNDLTYASLPRSFGRPRNDPKQGEGEDEDEETFVMNQLIEKTKSEIDVSAVDVTTITDDEGGTMSEPVSDVSCYILGEGEQPPMLKLEKFLKQLVELTAPEIKSKFTSTVETTETATAIQLHESVRVTNDSSSFNSHYRNNETTVQLNGDTQYTRATDPLESISLHNSEDLHFKSTGNDNMRSDKCSSTCKLTTAGTNNHVKTGKLLFSSDQYVSGRTATGDQESPACDVISHAVNCHSSWTSMAQSFSSRKPSTVEYHHRQQQQQQQQCTEASIHHQSSICSKPGSSGYESGITTLSVDTEDTFDLHTVSMIHHEASQQQQQQQQQVTSSLPCSPNMKNKNKKLNKTPSSPSVKMRNKSISNKNEVKLLTNSMSNDLKRLSIASVTTTNKCSLLCCKFFK